MKLVTKDFLSNRQKAYQLTFPDTPPIKTVLADLEEFCRAKDTCFHADPRVHAVLEGRREVFLRIKKHLDLSTEELIEYYTQQKEKQK